MRVYTAQIATSYFRPKWGFLLFVVNVVVLAGHHLREQSKNANVQLSDWHSWQPSRIERETHAFHSNLTHISANELSPAFLPHSLVPLKSEISIQKFEKNDVGSFFAASIFHF